MPSKLSKHQIARYQAISRFFDGNLATSAVNIDEIIEFHQNYKGKFDYSLILWISIVGNYPSTEEIYLLDKLLEYSTDQTKTYLLGKKKNYTKAGLPETIICESKGKKLYDVTETKDSEINSGIQRITRRVAFELQDQIQFVSWHAHLGLYCYVQEGNYRNSLGWEPGTKTSWLKRILKQTELFSVKVRILVYNSLASRKSSIAKFFLKILQYLYRSLIYVLLKRNRPKLLVNSDLFELVFDPYQELLILELQNLDIRILDRMNVILNRKVFKCSYLVHDTLPIRMPDYFPSGIVGNFVYQADNYSIADKLYVMSKSEGKHLQLFLDSKENSSAQIQIIEPPQYYYLTKDHNLENMHLRFHNKRILIVGSLEPRKNHKRMLNAISDCKKEFPNLEVVLVYPNKWFESEIKSKIYQMRQDGVLIRTLSGISDSQLFDLYSKSTLLMYCSIDEGLGLPILEARSFGLPVLTSDRGFMLESASFGGIVNVDPFDTRAISAKLGEVLRDFTYWEKLHYESEKLIGLSWDHYSRQFKSVTNEN